MKPDDSGGEVIETELVFSSDGVELDEIKLELVLVNGQNLVYLVVMSSKFLY